jgi:hypothetical protein
MDQERLRQYQAHLLHKPKLKRDTVAGQVAALRFFFVRTLKRRFPPDFIPYPKYTHHRVPRILSPEEVGELIDAAGNLQARAFLMLLYNRVSCAVSSCTCCRRVLSESVTWVSWRIDSAVSNCWPVIARRPRGPPKPLLLALPPRCGTTMLVIQRLTAVELSLCPYFDSS